MGHTDNWTTPHIQHLKTCNLPPNTDKGWLAKAARYMMIGDELYKQGYGQPLLKYITREQAEYILREIHEGICGYHSSARTMTSRILRVGYFWATMEGDCQAFVKKCILCQKHSHLIHQKQEQLHSILSPWPFAKWGMDILGPFTLGKGQVKFIIVGIDYFTKWIEVKPLATIITQQVQQFVWKDIICRYKVSHTIITNNGRQFIDKELAKFYTILGIKHITNSVEHPQTNGQAETTHKVILVEFQKRLDGAKVRWQEDLLEVLWAFRCTPQSATNESPFSLVYEAEAMIPAEIGEHSLRRQVYDHDKNE